MTTRKKKPEEWRVERSFPSRVVAAAEGYVMVKRKGCAPYVMTKKEWEKCPLCEKP